MTIRLTRAGAILGVADFAASLRFYRDQLGLEVLAVYDDPPYTTFNAAAARISLAEQNHQAPDRPGVVMSASGVPFLAPIHHPPWGGSRFFCVDPDGYLVEIEEPG